MLHRLLAVLSTAILIWTGIGASPQSTRVPAFFEQQVGTLDTSGYSPAQIATAYQIAPLYKSGITGSGQRIAFIELDRFDPIDLQMFGAAAGLPAFAVKESYAGGKAFALVQAGETTMDLEWAHAIAPGAALSVYYLKNAKATVAGWKELAQTIDQVTKSGTRILSMSFGACTLGSGYEVVKQALARALKAGVSVFVSSGDSGSFPGPPQQCGAQPGVAYPAGDPSVVAVGGTTLLLNTDDSRYAEAAWGLSGGGKAKPLPRPAWQVTPNLLPGKYRYVPDVAFLADTRTGVAMYYGGSWMLGGGTSLGAPVWAAIWALIRQDAKQAGKLFPTAPKLLYQIGNSPTNPRAFNDITIGANGHYQANIGWDPVTGWGTPIVDKLANAVLARLAKAP
ncbi:MAG TPA: S53 family peptidase [Chloroflexota bacterium]|nr:S53 family peptidase [Chloroflexota bacterium]